jgi:hypothetical protein
VIAVLAAGCTKPDAPAEVPDGLVRVSDDVVVRTDTVGYGKDAKTATFVLVDATNLTDHDLLITLGGELVGEKGTLRPESLRMPAGASRLFVLVDDHDTARPGATGAKVFVRGAVPPTWTPTITLTDGHAFDDHGKVMLAANVNNEADREGTVIVMASFHDGDGKPVVRKFDVVHLDAKETKVVRFVGPEEAKVGTMYLGDSTY